MTPQDFPLESTWRLLIRDLGARPADVLRRARLGEDLLSRSGVRVSTDEYFRFWEALRDELDDPLFPIRLVEAATAEAFVPPLFAALCSPNLTVGLQRLSTYKRLMGPLALHVVEHRDALEVTFEWLDATTTPPESLTAMELAFIVKLSRMGTRQRIEPLRAVAPRPPATVDGYREFLGVPIEHGEHLGLRFSRQDAEQPFLTANPSLWTVFEPELRRLLSDLDDAPTVRDRVRAALLESLPSGRASVVLVAERLAMSSRTLQRRLAAERTTFQEILTETRRELARHYLTQPALSHTEISFLLGYEDPNSFFRAFHEWTGRTPEAARAAHARLDDGAPQLRTSDR